MGVDTTQSANAVSADYDRIAGIFEDLDLSLHRLKVLEKQIPLVGELKVAIARVLMSVLVLYEICATYVKMNGLGNSPFPSFIFLGEFSRNFPETFSLQYSDIYIFVSKSPGLLFPL